MALRSNLTPFHKAVSKALSFELEEEYDVVNYDYEKKEVIFNDIMRNLPSQNSATNFPTISNQILDTLELELDQLKAINIQWVIFSFEKHELY